MTEFLADESLDSVIIQVNDFLLYRLRVRNLGLSLDMSAGEFENQKRGPLRGKRNDSRVGTSLVSE